MSDEATVSPFRVKPYQLAKDLDAHRGWNRPQAAKGTICFAVYCVDSRAYFAYSYLTRDAAQAVADKANRRYPLQSDAARVQDIASNYNRTWPESCALCDTTAEQIKARDNG